MKNLKGCKPAPLDLQEAMNPGIAAYIDKHYWKYIERKTQEELEQFLYYPDER